MLIGYVSDERYVAVPEVLCEFIGKGESHEVRSRASGAVYADLEPGTYEVILYKAGCGSKRVELKLPTNQPYHFRLLRDGLRRLYVAEVDTGRRSVRISGPRSGSLQSRIVALWLEKRIGADPWLVR